MISRCSNGDDELDEELPIESQGDDHNILTEVVNWTASVTKAFKDSSPGSDRHFASKRQPTVARRVTTRT